MNGYAKPFWWLLGTTVLLIATVWTVARTSQASTDNDQNRRLSDLERREQQYSADVSAMKSDLATIKESVKWLDRLKQ